MKFQIEQAIEILRQTPITLTSLLRGLSGEWVLNNEGGDSWSPFDIVGHLIHGEETDWIPRAQIILEHGESKPFEPFDRFAMLERFKGASLDSLLDTFAEARRKSLKTLEGMNITPDRLDLRGTHPQLGTVTLGQLLSTWVVHDLGHLGQIARVMSKQYADEVGPWEAFLPILTK